MLKRPDAEEPFLPLATVLVVDDAAGARFLVSSTLDRLGFATLIASDGHAAMVNVRDFHPDALITDLEMPGMNGEELIKSLRGSENPILRDIPIIVCSSKTDEMTREHLHQLGANAILSKPVDVGLLAKTALRLFRTL